MRFKFSISTFAVGAVVFSEALVTPYFSTRRIPGKKIPPLAASASFVALLNSEKCSKTSLNLFQSISSDDDEESRNFPRIFWKKYRPLWSKGKILLSTLWLSLLLFFQNPLTSHAKSAAIPQSQTEKIVLQPHHLQAANRRLKLKPLLLATGMSAAAFQWTQRIIKKRKQVGGNTSLDKTTLSREVDQTEKSLDEVQRVLESETASKIERADTKHWDTETKRAQYSISTGLKGSPSPPAFTPTGNTPSELEVIPNSPSATATIEAESTTLKSDPVVQTFEQLDAATVPNFTQTNAPNIEPPKDTTRSGAGVLEHDPAIEKEIHQNLEIVKEWEYLHQPAHNTAYPLRDPQFIEARRQPKPRAEKERLAMKYASIEDVSERAFQVLLDLGMIEASSEPVDMAKFDGIVDAAHKTDK